MKHILFSPITFLLMAFCMPHSGTAQLHKLQTDKLKYKKNEFNLGLNYTGLNERESWLSDNAAYIEEMMANNVSVFAEKRLWDYDEDRQYEFSIYADAGPLWGKGNLLGADSTRYIQSDFKRTGARASVLSEYLLRFYYNKRNYTLLEINGRLQYDFYLQKSAGSYEDTYEDKLKTEINGRAGWGLGRLAAVNHYMTAEYILKKYYPEREFTPDEILVLAGEIGRIKNSRELKKSHLAEIDLKRLEEFLNQKMILVPTRLSTYDWESGEFLPRFHGNRFEFGPYFQYYNREPDFVYGGYVSYENEKYCNLKWNRTFNAMLKYGSYKQNDWIVGQVKLAFSYFQDIESKWDIGLEFVPGLEIGDEQVWLYHGYVPYFSWFSQLNAKNRIEMNLNWRLTSDDQLMMPGPGISVSVYTSKY